MSWTNFHARVKELMEGGDFVASETAFDLENLPSSAQDKVFCILVPSFGEGNVRARTLNPTVRLAVTFDLGNSSVTLYNTAIGLCEWIISTIKRDNMSGNAEIEFVGAQTRINKTENYMICEFTFNAYYQI